MRRALDFRGFVQCTRLRVSKRPLSTAWRETSTTSSLQDRSGTRESSLRNSSLPRYSTNRAAFSSAAAEASRDESDDFDMDPIETHLKEAFGWRAKRSADQQPLTILGNKIPKYVNSPDPADIPLEPGQSVWEAAEGTYYRIAESDLRENLPEGVPHLLKHEFAYAALKDNRAIMFRPQTLRIIHHLKKIVTQHTPKNEQTPESTDINSTTNNIEEENMTGKVDMQGNSSASQEGIQDTNSEKINIQNSTETEEHATKGTDSISSEHIEKNNSNETEKEEEIRRAFFLKGYRGVGKSSVLTHVVHYARKAGWIVIYVPYASQLLRTGVYCRPSKTSVGMFNTPVHAQRMLKHLCIAHGEQLKEMPVTDPSVIRRYRKKEDSPDTIISLWDVAQPGLAPFEGTDEMFESHNKQAMILDAAEAKADRCVTDILAELWRQTDVPVLLAVDEYDQLYQPSRWAYEKIPEEDLRRAKEIADLEDKLDPDEWARMRMDLEIEQETKRDKELEEEKRRMEQLSHEEKEELEQLRNLEDQVDTFERIQSERLVVVNPLLCFRPPPTPTIQKCNPLDHAPKYGAVVVAESRSFTNAKRGTPEYPHWPSWEKRIGSSAKPWEMRVNRYSGEEFVSTLKHYAQCDMLDEDLCDKDVLRVQMKTGQNPKLVFHKFSFLPHG